MEGSGTRLRTISIPTTMLSLGLRLLTLTLLVSAAGAQRVQLHNCAKMILITGKFWPCIVWQRPNATTTSTSSTTESTSTSTELPTSSTTEESTKMESTTMETTTTQKTSTSTAPATMRRSKTTMKKEPTTEEQLTTELPTTTTVVHSTSRRVETTTETEEMGESEENTTEKEVTSTEMRARRVKPVSTTTSTTMSSTASTTTEEEKTTEESTTMTTTRKTPTTTDVEIQVVTRPQKKGDTSTSESVEEEEDIGVVQSTTPPPYFVTLLTDRSRDEFYRIAKNPFLTKAELLYRIRRWASKQPNLVREAIFDIEHELIRQQASVRKEAAAILEALPLAFLQYTNIRDNVALTKQEEQEDLDALYKAMPRKTAKVLRYVLMMAGDSMDSAKKEENKLRQFSVRSTIRDTLG